MDKDNKVKITFEIDKGRAQNFALALETLKIDKDEAFSDFIALLISRALRGQGPVNQEMLEAIESKRKLTSETIKSRIEKWAKNKDSLPHHMLKAYFEAKRYMPDGVDGVYKEKMMGRFNILANIPHSPDYDYKYKSLLTQMCSDAIRAYGNVFINNRQAMTVKLNPEYEELLLSLQNEFEDLD